MGSKLWAATKVVAIAGVSVFAVSVFAGPTDTANVATTAVVGTAWGVGVLGGAAKYIGPGFQSGMAEAGKPTGFDGLGNAVGKSAGEKTVKELCSAEPKPKACK